MAGLHHTFGDVVAVNGISFSVEAGEVYSLLGPNGAGKSTLINVLCTLLPVQRGSVHVAGFNITKDPALVRRVMGIVFQEVTLDRDMTVAETLEFHGWLYEMDRGTRRARARDLMTLVELETKRDTLTKHLSGGMKRRLEIARGLMTRPQVLILDEPTIGLDPRTRMRVWDYIRTVNREGTTILLTTHYMDEADHLSNRISIVDDGKIVITGDPAGLKDTLGRDVITLETSDDNRAAGLLSQSGLVRGVTLRDGGVVMTTAEEGSRVLPLVFSLLTDAGIAVRASMLKEPSMDDVFLFYTGRELGEQLAGQITVRHSPRGR
ncbi:MAG: ATP-binding cassette domain-containing protein [Methanomicrobiales archaeon]|nr:ATP-binding cassette domain-containing protein [Methanomicrobiales archaeon]